METFHPGQIRVAESSCSHDCFHSVPVIYKEPGDNLEACDHCQMKLSLHLQRVIKADLLNIYLRLAEPKWSINICKRWWPQTKMEAEHVSNILHRCQWDLSVHNYYAIITRSLAQVQICSVEVDQSQKGGFDSAGAAAVPISPSFRLDLRISHPNSLLSTPFC